MSDHLPSIDLELPRKLQDRDYRQAFFLAESSALIAKQLIGLRKRRGLNQTQVAEALDTGQPAISRVERADYRNWSFNTLRRLAAVLDGRLRVYLEASEDVLHEYGVEEAEYTAATSGASAATDGTEVRQQAMSGHFKLTGSVVAATISMSTAIPNQRQFTDSLPSMSEKHGISCD